MKETMYILHGWAQRSGGQNKKLWQPFIDLIEEDGREVEFLKIPGLSAPLNEVWDLDNFVSWLDEEITKKSRNNKVVILGHSFGGQIAIRFTAQNPDKVSQLILIDSAGIRDKAPKAVIKRTVFLLMAKVGKLIFRATIFRNLLYKLARERDYQNAPPLLRRTMSKILDDEVLHDLPKITCQTQIIWGEHDKSTPVKHAYQMHEAIENSTLNFVSDARHSPQFTHPSETASIVKKFLG